MKKQKLTDWFPADVKPVHAGVYMTRLYGKEGWAFFENGIWGNQRETKTYALTNPGHSGHDKQWRGLANPPKETKQKGEK